ncbi:MAG: hypothetical protein LBM08_15090 [Dysgonamonadaceae bacterium]|jgi:hypothetical protein|nr:hypothetical protein [Dysgonamonadaceae bacterium]
MKRVFLFACMAVVTLVLFNSCGGSRAMYFTLPQEEPLSNYTDNSLRRFVQDPENEGASVVVREPFDKGSWPGLQNRVASLVENGLMRNKYNPRNRRLFENAMEKLEDGSDYVTIRQKTNTDLIFEVDFNIDEYAVSEYSLRRGQGAKKIPFVIGSKKDQINPIYMVYGFSIEIKVILLADNKIAGVYKYYQTPCIDGCRIKTYDANKLTYFVPADPTKNIISDESARVQTRWEKYEKQISEFINNIVIPNMFAEIKTGSPVSSYNNDASVMADQSQQAWLQPQQSEEEHRVVSRLAQLQDKIYTWVESRYNLKQSN